MSISLRIAEPQDTGLILEFIRGLAAYSQLLHECRATEEQLRATLFGPKPAAECLLAHAETGEPAGFAVFFTNYSTLLAKPGIYLEDLFVTEVFRGRGIGKAILLHLAKLANERGCGRVEWTVLDWNQPAMDFYASLGARRVPDQRICRLTGPELARYA